MADAEDYVVDGFVSPTDGGESKGDDAAATTTAGDVATGAAADAADGGTAEQPRDAVSVRVRLPSGKEVPMVMGLGDHAGIIRQYLAEVLDVCCETAYELHVRNPTPGCPPSVLAGFVPLSEYGLQDNDVIRMVRVPYDMRTAQAHVRRLRDVLQSPPVPQPTMTQITDAAGSAGWFGLGWSVGRVRQPRPRDRCRPWAWCTTCSIQSRHTTAK